MCERLNTPTDEGYARIILRGSTTLKNAVEVYEHAPRLATRFRKFVGADKPEVLRRRNTL